ncbi:recombinase RecT [Aliarcobacter cryaerophilus]|uniref:recombinase RecT n=1 Tax=Aliarcobacter cryaerophilus TaxID=28198 RepID=UPI0021B51A50|nr:recombinase RecT [Aliarcobacter cryaerophilus]MCT7528784.1 recombinase RecT [Aliarcobacter cryaerophilus]
MSRNDLIVREQEARNIVGAKAKQISVLVGKDEAKTSKFMSALVQLSQNKNLIECKVDTIVDVGFQIVQAGLNPNPLFGQAYVVPFKLKSGFTVAQLQVGYKGYIQLGYRAGWKFKAVPVYKCDKFDYKFGGFEDDIVLEPNYEARNEDDGNWIFKNLVGVIVYAKDKDDYIVTEFVAFKKLEKLRLKSQNQVKDKLQYIWLDWAEEMYKAKALKYVVTRLPIEDDVQELISSEDSVYKMEDAPVVKETKAKQNINDLNSLAIDVEVSAPKELTPKELITKELINRGLTQEEAGKWCYGKSDDEFNQYLNDPASIDTILEEIRGF